jgi:hypothetical protein
MQGGKQKKDRQYNGVIKSRKQKDRQYKGVIKSGNRR